MPTYYLLSHPGHNRVYHGASLELALAELEICGGGLSGGCHGIRRESVKGVEYILFDGEGALSAADRVLLSRLSFPYALFRGEGEGNALRFAPEELEKDLYFGESVGSILKYSGKTNELFTRMMINLALSSGRFAGEERIALLDPVAGKGTTLFEGLRLGFDVAGIEIGGKAVQEACAYFKRYLEAERYKHASAKQRVSGENKSFTAHVYRYEFARDKAAFADEAARRTLTMAEGNSRYADKILGKGRFHLLVGDLPYGVAHGNVTNQKQSSLTRNPSELLEACLPAWHSALRPGGSLALAWNVHVLPRADLAAILERHRFRVLSGGAYDRLEHRVDQSILRDVVVAVREN